MGLEKPFEEEEVRMVSLIVKCDQGIWSAWKMKF